MAVHGFTAQKVSFPGRMQWIGPEGNVRILYEPIDFLTKQKSGAAGEYQQVKANSDTGKVAALSAGSAAVRESFVILYCLTLA
jgi:hypothetical protein